MTDQEHIVECLKIIQAEQESIQKKVQALAASYPGMEKLYPYLAILTEVDDVIANVFSAIDYVQHATDERWA